MASSSRRSGRWGGLAGQLSLRLSSAREASWVPGTRVQLSSQLTQSAQVTAGCQPGRTAEPAVGRGSGGAFSQMLWLLSMGPPRHTQLCLENEHARDKDGLERLRKPILCIVFVKRITKTNPDSPEGGCTPPSMNGGVENLQLSILVPHGRLLHQQVQVDLLIPFKPLWEPSYTSSWIF